MNRHTDQVAQQRLTTARLELVPLAEEHLGFEVELDADPAVMRYLEAGGGRTREQVERAHVRRLACAVDGLGYWMGFVDGTAVGWWLLVPPDRADQGPPQGQAELGYRLLRRFWRQGLAGEGAAELIRHGFTDLGLNRIFAETMAVNAASRATMTRVAMTYVRTFHLQWDDPIEGVEHGEVEYAITAARWRATRP